jgi:hypothetical protein
VARIAISYRREDSAGITGRIFDRLVTHFGPDTVFRDVDNIPLGVDFRQHIESVLAKTDVALIIIGKRWLGSGKTRRRIDDPTDPVRVEVETALRRGMSVIPLLVDGSSIPTAERLPDGLKDLSFRNGLAVDSGRDFDQHIERLIRNVERIFAEAARRAEEERQRTEAERRAGEEQQQTEGARRAEEEQQQAEPARRALEPEPEHAQEEVDGEPQLGKNTPNSEAGRARVRFARIGLGLVVLLATVWIAVWIFESVDRQQKLREAAVAEAARQAAAAETARQEAEANARQQQAAEAARQEAETKARQQQAAEAARQEAETKARNQQSATAETPPQQTESLEKTAQRIGTAGAWTAYLATDAAGRVCYLVGKPEKSEPAGAPRKPPIATVTHRPAKNLANVVNFIEGYPLREGSDVALAVGASKFELFTKNDSAWARTSDLDKSIVAALAQGTLAIVKGQPQNGPVTTDVYALDGFPAALALIDKACDIKR